MTRNAITTTVRVTSRKLVLAPISKHEQTQATRAPGTPPSGRSKTNTRCCAASPRRSQPPVHATRLSASQSAPRGKSPRDSEGLREVSPYAPALRDIAQGDSVKGGQLARWQTESFGVRTCPKGMSLNLANKPRRWQACFQSWTDTCLISTVCILHLRRATDPAIVRSFRAAPGASEASPALAVGLRLAASGRMTYVLHITYIYIYIYIYQGILGNQLQTQDQLQNV